MNWLTKFKIGLITFILCSNVDLLAHQAPSTIYELMNSDFAGESDQIKGVAHALDILFKEKTLSAPHTLIFDLKKDSSGKAFDFSSLDNIPRDTPHAIFISSGTYGIEAFHQLKERRTKGIFVYVSHQILEDDTTLTSSLKSLANVATLIVLPHHIFEGNDPRAEDLKKTLSASHTTLLEITGVAHNVQKEELSQEANIYQDKLRLAQKYMLVVLGGDVQNQDGKTWTYYTPQDAQKLATYVVSKMEQDKDLCVLVTNGPRTGKFDPSTTHEAEFHKKGAPLDPVTKAFMDAIPSHNKNQLYLFNFEKGETSLFKALLGLTSKSKGYVLIPGESTSMISQAIDNMPCGSVILYMHKAMQQIHTNHLNDELQQGRAALLILSEDTQTYTLKNAGPCRSISPISSSTLIAKKIWELIHVKKEN